MADTPPVLSERERSLLVLLLHDQYAYEPFIRTGQATDADLEALLEKLG